MPTGLTLRIHDDAGLLIVGDLSAADIALLKQECDERLQAAALAELA